MCTGDYLKKNVGKGVLNIHLMTIYMKSCLKDKFNQKWDEFPLIAL